MENIQSFVMVNNDLLASTRLNSTQKLFISYIIGWQKSNLTCKMTNRNLAKHFGMKYAGMRSMINKLIKKGLLESTQFGHTVDNSSWTSGHEIKVNEAMLNEFLKVGKSEKNMAIEDVSSYSEDEIKQQNNMERLNAIKDGIEVLRPLESMLINVGSIILYKGMISPLETIQESIDNVDCINDAFLKEMEVDLLIVTEVLESKKRILDLETNYSEPQMEEEIADEKHNNQEETLNEPEQIIFQEVTVDNKELQNDKANDFDAKNEKTVPDDNETEEKSDLIETIVMYGYEERVDLFVVMNALGFNLEEYETFRKHFITPHVPFKDLIDHLIDLNENQKKGVLSGVSVSDEVIDKLLDMIIRETINSH